LQIQLLAAERVKHDLAPLVIHYRGGVTGAIEEVGLFVTTLVTPDNVRTFVGNNKLFSDNIQPTRRLRGDQSASSHRGQTVALLGRLV
jgi:small-conductance mechanosensitive channel